MSSKSKTWTARISYSRESKKIEYDFDADSSTPEGDIGGYWASGTGKNYRISRIDQLGEDIKFTDLSNMDKKEIYKEIKESELNDNDW